MTREEAIEIVELATIDTKGTTKKAIEIVLNDSRRMVSVYKAIDEIMALPKDYEYELGVEESLHILERNIRQFS